MDYLLENKVKVSTDSEFKSLYKWSLFEVDSNEIKTNGDWVPFFWSLWFTAKSVEVHTRLSIEDERQEEVDADQTKTTASQSKFISATLVSGCLRDGIDLHNQVRYAMFGTSRFVSEFNLTIKEAEKDEGESCTLYAFPSYESEGATFETETEPDYVGFDVCVSKDKFDELLNLIETKAVSSVGFYVSGVHGIYSHWTPSISTSTIKVLSRNCDIVNKEEVNLKIPYVGKVREFNLTFTLEKDLVKMHHDYLGNEVHANIDKLEVITNDRGGNEETDTVRNFQLIAKQIMGVKILLMLILGAVVFALLR